jgi:hypothetical protein
LVRPPMIDVHLIYLYGGALALYGLAVLLDERIARKHREKEERERWRRIELKLRELARQDIEMERE